MAGWGHPSQPDSLCDIPIFDICTVQYSTGIPVRPELFLPTPPLTARIGPFGYTHYRLGDVPSGTVQGKKETGRHQLSVSPALYCTVCTALEYYTEPVLYSTNPVLNGPLAITILSENSLLGIDSQLNGHSTGAVDTEEVRDDPLATCRSSDILELNFSQPNQPSTS